MKTQIPFLFLLLSATVFCQKTIVVDTSSNTPVSFATISFGDGRGTFASEDGGFDFSKKKYPDIDSLFISSVGYKQVGIATANLPKTVFLSPETSQLSEVIVTAPKLGKFKIKKQKPTTHTDIFTCWLPTVESEVAVRFDRYEGKSTQIEKLKLPINAESQYKTKGKGKYATIFRIQFYENNNGLPGKAISHEKIVFPISEKEDKIFELDITSQRIFIPKTGIFASLQVLGYADTQGHLLQSKKYREVKTRKGIQKISTSFRPLLPFSNELSGQQTFVRRIFFNRRRWQVFNKKYNQNSKLIQTGHRNYGMGATFRVYQE